MFLELWSACYNLFFLFVVGLPIFSDIWTIIFSKYWHNDSIQFQIFLLIVIINKLVVSNCIHYYW